MVDPVQQYGPIGKVGVSPYDIPPGCWGLGLSYEVLFVSVLSLFSFRNISGQVKTIKKGLIS